MTLTRKKDDMTGQANISVFMNYVPNSPVLEGVLRGMELLIYVGGKLAFTGIIDRRTDTGDRARNKDGTFRSGPSNGNSLSLGPTSYTVQLVCRGKTKQLVDNSHQGETTVLSTTNEQAVRDLVAPWGVSVQWEAEVIDLERIRYRNGSIVFDEIERIAELSGAYVTETRDGQLRVTDQPATTTGEAIVLGRNVLTFRTDQLGDLERSEVTVQGQLNNVGDWGANAILGNVRRVADGAVQGFAPVTTQLYGNGDEASLQRRAQYESNKQATGAKQISVEVFHVQQSNGEPWDLGDVHYVEIPPAGVAGSFEVVQVEYKVDATRTLKTRLTMAPLPVSAVSAAATGLDAISIPDFGASLASVNVGALAQSWTGSTLSDITSTITDAVNDVTAGILQEVEDAAANLPPLDLPAGFDDD